MDVVLFDRSDMPVLIPQAIVDSQKALTKKASSPSKKKASAVQASQEGAAALGDTQGSAKLTPALNPKNSSSPTGSRKTKGVGRLLSDIHSSGPRRATMTQKQIDKQLQYLLLEADDQRKDFFNSLTRIQNLMSLDVMYITKADEIMKKEVNTDLQSSTEALQKA